MIALALISTPALKLGLAPGPRPTSRIAPVRHAAVLMEADGGAVLKDCGGRMKKSVANVQEQLATLRVGRATPNMLDRVMVDYYGAPTALNTLASITVSGNNQLVVDV